MSTPSGAVALQGSTSGVTGVASPQATSTKGLISVIRDILHHVQVYHHEEELNAALRALTAYEKAHINPSDRSAMNSENDPAPREDVRTRTAASQMAMSLPSGVQIDYNLLAAALVRAQAEQASKTVTATITDVPPNGGTGEPNGGTGE